MVAVTGQAVATTPAKAAGAGTGLLPAWTVMLLSGVAGLGYEIVWTRMLAAALGHEVAAALAVIAAFFCGLAVGAWALDGRVRRSDAPGRWYVALELVIAAWALVLAIALPLAATGFARVLDPAAGAVWHWTVAFGGTFLLLLPATAAMGATLPALESLYSRLRGEARVLPGLYAANTFGAVAGTLLATFVLAPALGYTRTILLLVAVNLACAVLVAAGPARGGHRSEAVRSTMRDVPGRGVLLATLFVTGLLGVGYEVLMVRLLGQLLENTVYSFASVLAVYLAGTACGAAWYQRRPAATGYGPLLAWLLAGLAAACTGGALLLFAVPAILASLGGLLGYGSVAGVAAEIVVAATVLGLPTVVMGACFAHLALAARDVAGIGHAVAANTLGAAVAPVLFGVVLLPLTGPAGVVLVIGLGYLGLAALVPGGRSRVLAVSGLAIVAAVALAPPLRFVTLPPGGRLVAHVDGVMAAVDVVEDAGGGRQLKVNDRYTMGGTGTAFSDRRQAHLPLLMHGSPRTALFLGLGPGMTFAASAAWPGLVADGVELIPEIVDVLPAFGTSPAQLGADGRLRVISADARRFVQAAGRYDVIVADLFHPSRDGAGALYTVEHFAAIRARLNAGGVFCQWLPLYQLDAATLKTIVRTFVAVFPEAEAHLGHYSLRMPILGLVARLDPKPPVPGPLAAAGATLPAPDELAAVRMTSGLDLFGGFLGAGESLRAFAGAGPLNTDDRPVVVFESPRFVYAAPEPASTRVVQLLDALAAAPGELGGWDADAGDTDAAGRFAAYWRARDAFLRAGVGVEPTDDARALLAQTRRPLLEAVRLSPDFAAAYDPLLGLAEAVAPGDPDAARLLLAELEAANPFRPEAAAVRRRLFGSD